MASAPLVNFLLVRLFQGQAGSAAERARVFARRRSVLDVVRQDAARLTAQLGSKDRAKLDEYLTGVRELELRIDALANAPTCEAERPDPVTAFPDTVRTLIDLTVLAFQCDLTRVASFMLANAASNLTYPFLGITDGHHQLSHHQGNADSLTKLRTIGAWEVEQFAYLVGRLKAVSDANGPLLDSSAVLFSSEIEDGDAHRHTNLPVLVAGRAGGALQPGRHVVYAGGPPLANLYVALLNALGAPTASFGDDGTTPLPGLSG